MEPNITELLALAARKHTLSREEITRLLALSGREEQALLQAADAVRAHWVGDEVHLRAIIEFSSYCCQNCLYCGLRRSNRRAKRYRLSPEQIVAIAKEGVKLGYRTIVLQSGEDPWYTSYMLARVVERIKNFGVAVTLSIGERSRAEYRDLRLAGADRYLLKHETADPALYARLHPGQSWSSRVRCLEWLAELGFQVGAGNIVGLPGQDLTTLAEDILFLKKQAVDMAGIGPFIPHPETPLASMPAGSVALSIRVLAVTRLLVPWTHLPATTALATLDKKGRQKALLAGANVIMPNITPLKYRGAYDIYPGKGRLAGAPAAYRWDMENLIASLGRQISTGPGHSLKPGRSAYGC